MFQNGTCVLTLQFPNFINVCYVFCYRWSLSTKKLRNLILRQPYCLVLQAHIQPQRVIWLIHNYLILTHYAIYLSKFFV